MPVNAGRLRNIIRAVDVPIVIVAAVLAAVMVLYAGLWWEADVCRAAGGRVAKYGLDHVCETGGGTSVPLPGLTPRDRVLMVAAWILLVNLLSWSMTRIVGRTSKTAPVDGRW